MKFSLSKLKKSKIWKKKLKYLWIIATLALSLLPIIYVASNQTNVNSIASKGIITISVKPITITDYSCNTTEWHFVINHIENKQSAPTSIIVTWGEDTQTIMLDNFTGKVAHYKTTSHLNSSVSNAKAFIYTGWKGQFNLSHGPCKKQPKPSKAPKFPH